MRAAGRTALRSPLRKVTGLEAAIQPGIYGGSVASGTRGCAQVAIRSQEAWADHFRATSARSRRPPVKAPPIHPWVMLIDG